MTEARLFSMGWSPAEVVFANGSVPASAGRLADCLGHDLEETIRLDVEAALACCNIRTQGGHGLIA